MLGRHDVDVMLEEMPEESFYEWMAFYRIEPFGPIADDERNGMLLAQRAERFRDSRKRREPYRASDFMLSRLKKEQRQKKLPLKVLREQMEAVLGKPTEVIKYAGN